MIRTPALILAVCLAAASLAAARRAAAGGAEPTAAGEWRVTFVVPTGTRTVSMYIKQTGARLTGAVVNEDGEFPLDGRLAGDQVTVSWSVPEDGKLMEILMKGKLSGDTITGTAKIGNVGEGPLTARRTADD
jgi:hypothetical protein